MMFETIRDICLGTALVFDSVLLATLLERRNWPFVRVPIVAMMADAWLWHGGQFALVLVANLPAGWFWHMQGIFMLAVATGAMLMPCGLLHSAWRVWQNKVDVQSQAHSRYGLAYLPLVCLAPMVVLCFAPDRGDFAAVTRSVQLPYFLFSGLVNFLAAAVFLAARKRTAFPHAQSFFVQMSFVLLGITALQGLKVFSASSPDVERFTMLAVAMSPLVSALLFAYFVIRYQFLQIVVGRSALYGALLCSVVFLHQLAFQDVSAAVPEGLRLHVLFLEGIVLAVLMVAYQPLRQRSAEALRYFLGARVSEIRERLRRLSVELSAQAGRPPHDMLDWFVGALRDSLQVDYVAGWLFDDAGKTNFRRGQTSQWTEEGAAWLFQRMRRNGRGLCSLRQEADWEVLHAMQAAAAALAILKSRPHLAGLLVIGRGPNNRELSEEETNAVLLLVEQLAITLDNSLLQAKQLASERRALQGEKLAAVGLLASSIAHEVKNPLSAIKTIATVMAEDLGPDSPHAEDLRLILGEVERLTTTTTELLATARPRASPRAPSSVPEVLQGTLRLLRHLASQQDIAIETRLADDLPCVQADDHALREIFFNLLSNSLEAAGPHGRVTIDCHRANGFVVTRVCDSGPGISEDVRRRLFEPFLTTKRNGTGLGLYAVGRHVSELGGAIHCDSSPGQGTSFTVKLPYQGDHDA